MRTFLAAALAAVLVAMMGCEEKSAPPPSIPTPPASSAKPAETPAVAKPITEEKPAIITEAAAIKPATNTKCIVMGDEIAEKDLKDAKTVTYKGQAYRVCCGDCIEAFNKEPAKYVKAE